MAWNKECHVGNDSEQRTAVRERHGTGNFMEGGTGNRECHEENGVEQGMACREGL